MVTWQKIITKNKKHKRNGFIVLILNLLEN